MTADDELARVVAWLRADAKQWRDEGHNLVAALALNKAADALARHRQSAEQRLIDIAQACLDQGYPLAVALEMMRNDPR